MRGRRHADGLPSHRVRRARCRRPGGRGGDCHHGRRPRRGPGPRDPGALDGIPAAVPDRLGPRTVPLPASSPARPVRCATCQPPRPRPARPGRHRLEPRSPDASPGPDHRPPAVTRGRPAEDRHRREPPRLPRRRRRRGTRDDAGRAARHRLAGVGTPQRLLSDGRRLSSAVAGARRRLVGRCAPRHRGPAGCRRDLDNQRCVSVQDRDPSSGSGGRDRRRGAAGDQQSVRRVRRHRTAATDRGADHTDRVRHPHERAAGRQRDRGRSARRRGGLPAIQRGGVRAPADRAPRGRQARQARRLRRPCAGGDRHDHPVRQRSLVLGHAVRERPRDRRVHARRPPVLAWVRRVVVLRARDLELVRLPGCRPCGLRDAAPSPAEPVGVAASRRPERAAAQGAAVSRARRAAALAAGRARADGAGHHCARQTHPRGAGHRAWPARRRSPEDARPDVEVSRHPHGRRGGVRQGDGAVADVGAGTRGAGVALRRASLSRARTPRQRTRARHPGSHGVRGRHRTHQAGPEPGIERHVRQDRVRGHADVARLSRGAPLAADSRALPPLPPPRLPVFQPPPSL